MLNYRLYHCARGFASRRWGYGLLIGLLTLLLPAGHAQAHGGTLIASSTSPNGRYGWMLSVSPYPVVTGPITFSLIVFDIKSSAIINTVAGEVYLAAPGSPRPCCEPDVHAGPFSLFLEPFQYGDYVAYVPIDQLGPWEVQFRLTVAEEPLTIVAPFEVTARGELDQAATQAAVDELIQAVRAQMGQTPPAASPLPSPTATTNLAGQAPSPLQSPLATPTLPSATALPLATAPPPASPAQLITALDPNWLFGGGVIMFLAGAGLLWWRIRERS